MSYCPPGTRATVNYRFGSDAFKSYTADTTPIDVDASGRYTPNFTGGQCPVAYNIKTVWYRFGVSLNNFETFGVYGAIEGTFTNRFTNFPGSPGYANYNHNVRAKDISGLTKDYLRGGGDSNINSVFGETFEIVSVVRADGQLDNCGNPPPGCIIKVLHKGQVIFADKGKCPITFSVACGDECPEGTTKCLKSDYPGYCCLPCAPIAAEIKAIASQIRSLTNG